VGIFDLSFQLSTSLCGSTMAQFETATAEKRQASITEEVGEEKSRWAASPYHLQDYMKAGLTQDDAEFLHSVGVDEQKKIFHKVDWRLCPMLAVLYLISHLDR
jgi:hypothetical protein